MKKISVIGATLLAAAVLCAALISLHQSWSLSVDRRSPCRATTNTRERCWRPPQASEACISPWYLITAATITLIATMAAITAIATMATISIIGATPITAIAIGSRQQTSYQRGARSAAHAAAFSRSLPSAPMHLPLPPQAIRQAGNRIPHSIRGHRFYGFLKAQEFLWPRFQPFLAWVPARPGAIEGVAQSDQL